MERFNQYIEKLHDEYENAVRHVKNVVENELLSKETLENVGHFAKMQDEQYGYPNESYDGMQQHFIDDIFEIVLAKNCQWDELTDSEKCVKMHDAWMLAYLYSFHGDGDILSPKEEGVLQMENIIIDEAQFDEHLRIGGKTIVGLTFKNIRTHITGEYSVLKVQARRLPQFVDYSLLEEEEKVKDMIPVNVLSLQNSSFEELII